MIEIAPSNLAGLRRRASIPQEDRDEMFALLARHFEGVSRAQFDRDLEAKNWVIAIRQEERLVGFTTLLVRGSRFEGEPITAIYSGDTIVAPEAWGTPALARAWIAGVNRIRAEEPARRCFWLLLTSGFRTYRFLPVFWREFFPCFDRPTPSTMQRLADQLAREGYGELVDASRGLVRFPQPQRLRGALAGVPEGRAVNPHIAFFLARNPGHAEGDELVCLTEISEANLTAAGRRMVTASNP
jgi:hypothetical protein